ncbi:MAG: adenylosuccinate lyase [Thermodesulfobacteriota bacterium]|nr:adenylosuccinate lyase [Thermodesulfobacteriota bacterium]
MIPRYTRKEMGDIWEPENRFRKWLDIEICVCEALAKSGEIPHKSLKNIKKKADFNIERIDEIERETKHDVIAFLTSVAEYVGEDARYIHMGLTSSDILDTSLSLLLKQAAEIIIKDIDKLLLVLNKKAFLHKKTVMIGRTHGIHAEPITFGLKMALWYEEMKRNLDRMKRAKETISYGKISGAVGTFAHLSPDVEKFVCRKLGLKPDPVSTQIIQRDRHAEYFSTLAIIASSLDKFAQEIRLLQRTEVREAEEFFSEKQKGSSAMPHKRNPILSENLSGLARLVRANALAAMENVPLWHERDISHSSVERVIGPDSTILIDFMLNRFTSMVERLVVYPEQMQKNLNLTNGIYYSQAVMLKLVQKGLSREDAYRLVQRSALNAWDTGRNFKETILKDSTVKKYLNKKEIEKCCTQNHYLQHVDDIFQRVFGKKGLK